MRECERFRYKIFIYMCEIARDIYTYINYILCENVRECERIFIKIYGFLSSNFIPILYKLSIYLCERLCEHFYKSFLQLVRECERTNLQFFSLQIVRECESISYKFSIQICARMCEIFKKKMIKITHKIIKFIVLFFLYFQRNPIKRHTKIPCIFSVHFLTNYKRTYKKNPYNL